MSYLRQIMQKLAQADASNKPRKPTGDIGTKHHSQHVADYQAKLQTCNPAMLQYEWCWLQQQIESLQLCLANTTMSVELGGHDQVLRLLKESEECKTLLADRMHKLGVGPPQHNHSILPGEHAWEVTHATIQQNWGF